MLKKDQKTEDIKKKIVKEVNDKVKKEIFPENIISRGAEFIYTGIPVGHAVNSIVDGNTVMKMPNAQVVGNSNVPMVYLNGETVPYGYASPGNDIKVLEIFEGMLLVLVPVGNGPTGDGQWTIGYFDTSVLGNTVEINYNTITWNDASNKTVVDGNGNFMYSLPADQIIQFLYETPNSNYACILFNGADGELLTGYVPMSDGTFYRYDYLRTGSLQQPGIANNTPTSSTSGGSSNNTPSQTNTSWEDLSLTTKLILFLASSEGFNSTWINGSIGYGDDDPQFCPYNPPITLSEAFQVSLNYITESINGESNLTLWQNTLNNAGLPANSLSDAQLIALYDFAYNAGSGSLYSLACNIVNSGDINNPPAEVFNVCTRPGTDDHHGLELRRSREWQTYCTGTIYLGGNVNQYVIPAEYLSILENMYIQPTYSYPFV